MTRKEYIKINETNIKFGKIYYWLPGKTSEAIIQGFDVEGKSESHPLIRFIDYIQDMTDLSMYPAESLEIEANGGNYLNLIHD